MIAPMSSDESTLDYSYEDPESSGEIRAWPLKIPAKSPSFRGFFIKNDTWEAHLICVETGAKYLVELCNACQHEVDEGRHIARGISCTVAGCFPDLVMRKNGVLTATSADRIRLFTEEFYTPRGPTTIKRLMNLPENIPW